MLKTFNISIPRKSIFIGFIIISFVSMSLFVFMTNMCDTLLNSFALDWKIIISQKIVNVSKGNVNVLGTSDHHPVIHQH